MIKNYFFLFAILSGLVLGSSFPLPTTALAQTADPVFVGAGDIADCSRTQDESTAQLLDSIPGTVFTLGDDAYPDGTLAQFNDCFGPTWGRHKNRTRPVPGNHEYHTTGAAGYYTYFGAAASPLDTNCTSDCKGYYSYNLGAWHIIALNSEIDHTTGSVQEKWLRADLAANQSMCTLAYWHKPRFSSGNHGNNSGVQPFWQALYDYRADVVLSGHDHTYERFAPQNPTGQADPTRGIREFVVGTGGRSLYPFPNIQPNSEVRNNTTWGVLKLTLHATSYNWEFVPIAGQTFTDAGSGNCVSTAGQTTPTTTRTPTATRTSTPTMTATSTATFTLSPSATPTNTATLISSLTAIPTTLTSDLTLTLQGTMVTPIGLESSTPTTTTTTQMPIPTSASTLPPSLTQTATAIQSSTPVSLFTETPTLSATQTTTSTPIPPPNSSDLIFTDNFESGNFSAWSSSTTDGADLSTSAMAALLGINGLQTLIDNDNPIYVADDNPTAERHYRVRFYFDPNSIQMANNDSYAIFNGLTGTSTEVLRVGFIKSSGNYQLRGRLLNDNSTWLNTSWFTISDNWHFIELDWKAATAIGANDGGLTLWIDGTQVADLTGVDNDTRRIDRVRLGAVAGIDSGTRGTPYFDAFESRRQTYIGPVAGIPIPVPVSDNTPPPSLTQTATAIQSSTPVSLFTETPTLSTTQTTTSTPIPSETPIAAASQTLTPIPIGTLTSTATPTRISTPSVTPGVTATIAPTNSPTPVFSSSCGGTVVQLSGVTTTRYTRNTVAHGTTFNRTSWYSNAVGNGTSGAFSIGSGNPPPYDVCVLGGVIDGHIPLSWTWDQTHTFGGYGDQTFTGHLVVIDGARVHNVEDGWKPRELPEFGNSGIMQMRNTYMTGIRDDSIENDNFMPGFIEDSLFDGVHTFLSEQNQSGGTPTTLGPNEDRYIRITRVYVRLYPTNSDGSSGRWFKWQPRGTQSHNLIITDSVFATHGPTLQGGWSPLNFPAGTTFQGTNYILWLGTPGGYKAIVPPGVIFLEGQAAKDKWNQVRNAWLLTHGYDPRPPDDFNPMDDPVLAPQ